MQVAERDQAQAVAGRADFLVDLEAALQLLPVELAERAVGREVQLLRLAWNSCSAVGAGGAWTNADQVDHRSDQQDAGEAQPDEKCR